MISVPDDRFGTGIFTMLNKNNIYYLLLLLFSVTLVACEDPNKRVLGECFEIPPPNNGGPSPGWNSQSRPYNYQKPVFNPNDPNEFVYVLAQESSAIEIRRHNIVTHEDQLITYKAVYYMLRFSKRGHLLFDWTDNQAWSVKLNGDSLRQLTSLPWMCLYPEWTDNGNAFIYYRDLGIGNRHFIKADFNGVTIDTLDFITVTEAPPHACSPDGNYFAVSVGTTQKYIYNLQTETVQILNHADYNSAAYEMSFSGDNTKLLWTANDGIHVTDILTGQTYTVANGCESKVYLHPSMSADGQKIIAARIDRIDISLTTLYSEMNIVIMNSDGSDEHILTLPQ